MQLEGAASAYDLKVELPSHSHRHRWKVA